MAAPLSAAPAPAQNLWRDPSDAQVAAHVEDGALFIGDTRDIHVAGRARDTVDVTAAAGTNTIDHANSANALSAAFADVAWKSAPRISSRALLAIDAADAVVVARAGRDPLLVVTPRGAVLAADLDDPANAALLRWGYLPYLVHVAAALSDGRAAPRFADWPFAPLPQRGLTTLWLFAVAILLLLWLFAFSFARRRARANPDAHVELFARLAAPRPAEAAWTRPGIARPLGGFFMFISATLLAMGPYLYVTAVLVPSRVQPFPDADGAWAPIEDFATLCWILADVGMTVAFIKRFSEHRVNDPARALATAQLWVWWQLAAGILLLIVGGTFACGILPHTQLALFSRVVILRATLQVPGILSLFTNFFAAIQRFDYGLLLDLLEKRLLFVLCPVPFILWLRAVGRAHPAVGESFGAVLGIAAGQYCALLITATIGLILYRRLRLPLAPLFLAGFDRRTLRDMLSFGFGIVAGKAPFFFANAIEFGIIATLLPGYVAWLGIRNLIMARLVFAVYFVWPFIDSAIPAVSEALAAKKFALARYYVVRYLQYGNLFVACVVAVLLGAGRPLVLHALSNEWRPVATYLPLACAGALFLPAAWLGDAFLKGAGRPTLDAANLIFEQLLRITLFWLLIPHLGFAGIFVAILIAVSIKTTIGWILVHRVALRLCFWPWRSVLAPLTAGALVYAAIAGATALAPASRAATVTIFAVAALLAFPAGFFLLGLVAGLDSAALDEIDNAAELAGALRVVARVLARAARIGASLSGIRPAPSLAIDAQREADQITQRIT